MNEYNKTPEETQSYVESPDYVETKEIKDNVIKDNPSVSEYGGSKPKKKRGKIFSISVTSLVGVVASVAVANNTILKDDSISQADINFTYEVYDTYIDYNLELTEYVDDLTIVLSNDFTNRKVSVTDANEKGSFNDLKMDTSYTISVVKKTTFSKETLIKEKLKTSKYIERTTKFNSVTYECKCSIDGYFYFSMDLIDENNFFSNYKATLTDSYGNTSSVEFSNPNVEQKIEVYEHGIKGEEDSVDFVITCDSVESGSTKNITLYEKKVTV